MRTPDLLADTLSETLDDYERATNALSIADIPLAQLPLGPARRTLVALAEAGEEVYAYRPTHQREWVIWHCRRGTGDEYRECRYLPQEWAAKLDIPLTDNGAEVA